MDKGYECQDNIYIIKSGEMNVWIKMTRDNIKTYDEKIDKYHVKNLDDYSHSELSYFLKRFKHFSEF